MHPSLESLLQTLVNSPEEDKRALTRSAVGLLREVCNMQMKSNYTKFRETAENARNILDKILVGKLEGNEEEDFLESGDFAVAESEIKMVETPITVEETQATPLHEWVDKWNEKVEPWLKISIPRSSVEENIRQLVKKASAVRSNLVSAAVVSRFNREEIKRFEKYWKLWLQEIEQQGYEVFPDKFGKLEKEEGRCIYTHRPTTTEREITLIMPGIKKKGGAIVSEACTLVTLPPETNFPQDHPDHDLAYQWRAILGELELLLVHLEIQHSIVCAVEAVNKTRIDPFAQCSDVLLNEITRRADALRSAIRQEETIYRLATNYWRIEECFWAIFHDDGRPRGYSFFDRLRRRVQAWHTVIRKTDKLYVRDFDAANDCLASINKYIGNIVLQTKEGVSPGTILRELRPAIIVKVNNSTRLLKGRVVAT